MSLYLGTAPIYWLPGLSVETTRLLKYGLFALVVLVVVLDILTSKTLFQKKLWGLSWFIAILFCSLPGLIQAPNASVISKFIGDLCFGFVFIYCFFHYTQQKRDYAQVIYKRSLFIIGIFALFVILIVNTGLPILTPYGDSFSVIGFGASSTGWSNGLALYLPITVLVFSPRFSRYHKMLFVVFFFIIIFNQVTVVGRAGLFASIVITLILLILGSPQSIRNSVVIIIVVLFLCLLVIAFFIPSVFEATLTRFRLDVFSDNLSIIQELDRISTGRVGVYLRALELISKRTFWGYGIKQTVFRLDTARIVEVHNFWLKWTLECGITVALVLFSMILFTLYRATQTIKKYLLDINKKTEMLMYILIILAGLILSMFEPNTPIGSFQNSAIWWAALGTVTGILTLEDNSTLP